MAHASAVCRLDQIFDIAFGQFEDLPPMRAKTCRVIAKRALEQVERSRRIEEEARRMATGPERPNPSHGAVQPK